MAAVEVPAPMAPVVVNGLRFKAKPEAEVVPETRDSTQATEEDTSATSVLLGIELKFFIVPPEKKL